MLTALRRALADAGLATAHSRVACNVLLNEHRVAHAFVDGRFVVARVLEAGAAAREHAALRDAFAVLGHAVPEPLALVHVDGTAFLFCRGVTHRPAQLEAVAAGPLWRNIIDDLNSCAAAFVVAPGGASHVDTARGVVHRYAHEPFAAVLAGWIDEAAARLDHLPHVRQHGDFVANNVGLTARGPVYFDWEDFGRVTLPWFDLVTLAGSAAGFDAGRLIGGPLPDALESRLTRERLSVPGYVLLCLATFLDVKERHGYGAGIIDRVRHCADELAAGMRERARSEARAS